MYPHSIGNMNCEDAEYFELMFLTGDMIGKVKMNFEQDADAGVAVKFKTRGNEMINEIGEFAKTDSMVSVPIPLEEQVIGFFGTEDANKNILSLGIVTK